MISKRDCKPFKVKFSIGVDGEDKKQTIYQDNWDTIYGIISDGNGQIISNVYGKYGDFDKVITVNAGSITRKIKDNTLFCIDNMPSDTFQYGDYEIKYIFPEYNGEIRIGLSKKEKINIPKIYFIHNNKILFYQLNLNMSNLNAFINKTENLPFNEDDYVWTRKPISVEQTGYRYIFKGKTKTGFSDNYKNFYELHFIGG